MTKYDHSVDQPAETPWLTTTEIKRPMHPVELAFIAMLAGAVVATLAAVFLERPWAEVWRWPVIGGGLPLLILFIATVTPLITWFLEQITKRDLNHDNVIGNPEQETIRLLPVRSQAPRVRLSGTGGPGYTEEDLRALLEITYNTKHTARDYLGRTLPSGRRITDYDGDLRPFIDMLVKAGLLVERSPRSKGRLVGDLDDALQLFGLL